MPIWASGSVAGTAQLVVATPVDVIKIKLQMQTVGPPRYRGPWHCALSLVKTQVSSFLLLTYIENVIYGFGIRIP